MDTQDQLQALLRQPSAAWLLTLLIDSDSSHQPVEWLIDHATLALLDNATQPFFHFTESELPMSAEEKAEAQEASQHFVVVGIGPQTPQHHLLAIPLSFQSLLCLDLRQPQQLWLAPSSLYPPFLWVPAGSTRASLEEALDVYFPPYPASGDEELTATLRFFIGKKSEMQAELRDFENRAVMHPFTPGALFWGSAFAVDPYTEKVMERLKQANAVQRSFILRETMEQSNQHLPSTSYRTAHSRSVITIEEHYDFWLTQVRYRPTPEAHHQPLVDAQERYGWPFVPDLPVDVITALWDLHPSGSEHIGPRTREGWQEMRPFARVYLLYILGALGGSGLRRKIPFVLDDPALLVRWMAMLVARWHRLRDYLQHMYENEPDPDLRASLEMALQETLANEGQKGSAPTTSAASPGQSITRVRMALKPVYRFHMMAVAWLEGWLWLSPEPVFPDENTESRRIIIWGLPENDTNLVYDSEDRENDLGTLILDGELAGRLAARVRSLVPIYTFAEIARLVDRAATPEELWDAIGILNRDFPQRASQPHLDLVRKIVSHPDAKIRSYAIRIMRPALWPEFLGLLEPLAAGDPDPEVRQTAAQMRQEIEQNRSTH